MHYSNIHTLDAIWWQWLKQPTKTSIQTKFACSALSNNHTTLIATWDGTDWDDWEERAFCEPETWLLPLLSTVCTELTVSFSSSSVLVLLGFGLNNISLWTDHSRPTIHSHATCGFIWTFKWSMVPNFATNLSKEKELNCYLKPIVFKQDLKQYSVFNFCWCKNLILHSYLFQTSNSFMSCRNILTFDYSYFFEPNVWWKTTVTTYYCRLDIGDIFREIMHRFSGKWCNAASMRPCVLEFLDIGHFKDTRPARLTICPNWRASGRIGPVICHTATFFVNL